jgi:glycosyltransferase involved in cell wall biosynthesis
MASALETVCSEVARIPIDVGFVGGQVPVIHDLSESCPFPVTVICANADQIPVLMNQPQWEDVKHTYKVGVWYWELEEFPEEFARNAQFLDELWVGSEFVRAAIRKKVSSIPISVIPPVVELPAPTSLGRGHFGFSENDFLIFAAMDCLSLVNRKNPQGVYDVFNKMKAATQATDLKLCIKLSNVEHADVDSLVARLQDDPDVILLDEDLERSEYSQLVRSVDMVVSLHRSEGFGLVPAEAMSVGKCVVATAYGGNTDYMNKSNSLPIDYKITPVGMGSLPYPADAHWAEPDLDDAVRKMVSAYESPELRNKLGLAAAKDISELCSPTAVLEVLKEQCLMLQKVRASSDE